MAGLSRTRERAEGSWILAMYQYRVTGNPLAMAVLLALATSSIIWTSTRPIDDTKAVVPVSSPPSARLDAVSLKSKDDFERAVRQSDSVAATGTRGASWAGGSAGEAGTASGSDGPTTVESAAAPETPETPPETPRETPPETLPETPPETPPETEERHELQFQPGVLDAIKSLPPFPKIVHYIWNDKNILEKDYQMLEHGAKKLRSLSPGWEFRVHDFDDMRRKLESFTHPDIGAAFLGQLRDAHIVEQTDAFRLITIYETGGLYVDIDRVANVDLNAVIPDGARMVLPTYYDINFAQDLFGSSPGNELILNVLKRQTELKADFKRINGWIRSSDHLKVTHMFSHSLEMDLFGPRRVYKTELWDVVRHLFKEHTGGAVVTKKDEWCDGLLITDYPGCKKVSRSDLYSDYGVKAWAGEVDKVFEDAEKKEENSPETPETPPETEERHELQFQPGVLDAVKSLPPFPKIVHYIWNDKDILEKDYQMLEHGAKKLRSLSPGWEFRVHDFDDMRRKLESFSHPDIGAAFLGQLRDAHIVEQTDAFRLITIYETGGLYVDIDRVANVDLNTVIPDGARMVLPTYYNINFAQDLFGSSPGNELILNVLKRQTEVKADFKRINGWIRSSDHLKVTHMFSHSLEEDFFGPRRVYKTELWDVVRHLFQEHTDGAVVTKKDEWCDGLLITDYPGCKKVSRSDLYSDYGVKAWAGEVDKVFEDAEKKEENSGSG